MFVSEGGVEVLHRQRWDQIEQCRYRCMGPKKVTELEGWGPPEKAKVQQGGHLQK